MRVGEGDEQLGLRAGLEAEAPLGAELDDLRPGLSTTALITVANKPTTLTIPIQALVQRDPVEEKLLDSRNGKPLEVSSSAAPANAKHPESALHASASAAASFKPSA